MAHLGKRLKAPEALTAGVIDHAVPAELVLSKATELAEALAPKGVHSATLQALKEEGYKNALKQLRLTGSEALGWGGKVGELAKLSSKL